MANKIAPEFFIGRDAEFKLVGQLLGAVKGTRRLLLLNGPGGFGKTRLLFELQRQQDRIAKVLGYPFLCFSSIDFDDVEMRLPRNILTHLAKYDPTAFADFSSKYRIFIQSEQKGVDADIVQSQWNDTQSTFIQCFNQVVQDKPGLILFDTFESIRASTLPSFLWELFEKLQNTVVVVAGRQVDQEYIPLVNRWNDTVVKKHDLLSFSPHEASDYFDHTDVGKTLEPEMKEKIFILTGGHPILIALADYWLSREIPLDHITARPLEELQALSGDALNAKRAEFEKILVGNILELTPIDQALLRMAYLHRQFNDEILQIALELDEEEVQTISAELHGFPFVKPRPHNDYTLHDVMRGLVDKHLWSNIDPYGLQRRKLAQRILKRYYEPQLATLQKKKKDLQSAEVERKSVSADEIQEIDSRQWRLGADRLYYELDIDYQKGYDYFKRLFESEISENHLQQCELLLNTVDEQKKQLAETPQSTTNLEIKRARWQWRSEVPETRQQAEQSLRQIIKRPNLDPNDELEAKSTVAGFTSNIKEAIQLYHECVKLAQKVGTPVILARMYNYLGVKYRRAGQWNEASKWYKKARRLAEENKDNATAAEAISYLAYLARLNGKTDEAEHLCGLALTLRERVGNERGLALSYQIYGEIYSDMRRLAKALTYFKRAEEIFRRSGPKQELALALGHIANIYRQEHESERVVAYLNEAIALHEQGNNISGLAAVYGEYGCEFRSRGWEAFEKRKDPNEAETNFVNAEEHFQKGLEFARESQDKYRETDILVDRALLESYRYRITGDIKHQAMAKRYLAQAKRIAKRYDFKMFLGRIEEMRGELAYADGKYELAFLQHYAQACIILAPYLSPRYHETLDRIQEKIRGIGKQIQSPKRANKILGTLVQKFKQAHIKELDELIKECDTAQKYLDWGGGAHARV